MTNKVTVDDEANRPRADLPPASRDVPMKGVVRFASGEKVERIAEKIFRLHARLFEELAK